MYGKSDGSTTEEETSSDEEKPSDADEAEFKEKEDEASGEKK